MVDQTTLSLTIDASEAKRGAKEFSRAVDDIKKKAVEMGRSIDRNRKSFRNMQSPRLQSSGALTPTVQTRTVSGSATISSSNNFAGTVVPMVGGYIGSGTKKELEKKRRRQERDQKIVKDDTKSKELFRVATGDSGDVRELAKILGAELLESTQTLDKEVLARLQEQEKDQLDLLNSHPDFRNNPTNFVPSQIQTALQIAVDQLNEIRKLREESERRINDRDEKLATLEASSPPNEVNPAEAAPHQNIESPDGSLLITTDDDRVKTQIEDATRSIELLKEQKTAIEDNAAAATAQKEQELDLLQREKDCLERLNKALQDNQTLRGLSGDQSDDILEGAAAYDDLSTAVDQNGEAAKGLKDQVDSLNTVLQSNANINTQIVGGLEKERDTRQQVNEAIVERRRLEDEQAQRLKQAQDDTERRGKAVEASIEQIKDAAADSFKDVIKGTESIGDAFQKLADRITDILLDLALDELLKGGTGFSDLFGAVFGGIGSAIGGGGGGDPLGLLTPAAFGGGIVPFHTGGIVGLRPDEIPIIAQRGEEVLTRNDPRHRDNGGSGGNSGGVVVNVNFPNARNTDEARQAGSEIAALAA